jgi:hypothetical protein
MGLEKRFREKLPDGKRVYYVNEAYVNRQPGWAAHDFMAGGNPARYPRLVPRGEIWLGNPSHSLSRHRYRAMHTTPTGVMLHEASEVCDMEFGHLPYKAPCRGPSGKKGCKRGAHPAANRLERRYLNGELSKEQALRVALQPERSAKKRRR